MKTYKYLFLTLLGLIGFNETTLANMQLTITQSNSYQYFDPIKDPMVLDSTSVNFNNGELDVINDSIPCCQIQTVFGEVGVAPPDAYLSGQFKLKTIHGAICSISIEIWGEVGLHSVNTTGNTFYTDVNGRLQRWTTTCHADVKNDGKSADIYIDYSTFDDDDSTSN